MGNLIKPSVANWGNREWLSIFKSIISRKVRQGSNIDNLITVIAKQYPHSNVILLNSARAGLVLSLQLFKKNKPLKTEVIIPEFICNSVPDVIKKCGLIPVYAPVSKDLNLDVSSLDEKCSEQTLAVILPHMYAKPADVKGAESILKQKGIYLVDDAAQVSGIAIDGKPLGSFGDVGILSFAQAKTIVTGVQASGGVLFVNNKALEKDLVAATSNLPDNNGRVASLIHFFLSYIWQGLGKKIDYYYHRIAMKIIGQYSIDNYSPITNISNMDAGVALVQFASLHHRIEQSKLTMQLYQDENKLPEHVTFPQIDERNLYLTRMIIQSKELSPGFLSSELAQQGIITKFVYGTGSKDYDGSFTSGLLELPLQRLNTSQVNKIIQSMIEVTS